MCRLGGSYCGGGRDWPEGRHPLFGGPPDADLVMGDSGKGIVRTALAQPAFRRLLAGSAVSEVGSELYSLGILIYLFEVGGGPVWVGIAVASRTFGAAVFGPIAGAVGDRVDRRMAMVVLNLFAAAVMAAMIAVVVANAPLVVLVICAGMLAAVGSAVEPLQLALVPATVPETNLGGANAALAAIQQVTLVAGPALGAILLAVTSITVLFALNAASFAIAALVIVSVRPAYGSTRAQVGERNLSEDPAASGSIVGLLRHDRGVLAVILIAMASTIAFGFEMVLFVVIASEQPALGTDGVGWLAAAAGLGGVLASAGAGRMAGTTRGHHLLVWSGIAASACLALTGFVPFLPALLVILAAYGGTFVVADVVGTTILQRLVPDTHRARVFGVLLSASAIAIGGGALAATVLADRLGLKAALVLQVVLVAGTSLPLLPALRNAARRSEAVAAKLAPAYHDLAGLAIFADLPTTVIESLAGATAQATSPAGTAIVIEGQPADDLYVIHQGELEVISTGERGEAETVTALGPGDWFGEIGLLQRRPRTATVVARTPVSLWRIPGDSFLHAMRAQPTLPAPLAVELRVRLARTHPALLYDVLAGLLKGTDGITPHTEQTMRVAPPVTSDADARRTIPHRHPRDADETQRLAPPEAPPQRPPPTGTSPAAHPAPDPSHTQGGQTRRMTRPPPNER